MAKPSCLVCVCVFRVTRSFFNHKTVTNHPKCINRPKATATATASKGHSTCWGYKKPARTRMHADIARADLLAKNLRLHQVSTCIIACHCLTTCCGYEIIARTHMHADIACADLHSKNLRLHKALHTSLHIIAMFAQRSRKPCKTEYGLGSTKLCN